MARRLPTPAVALATPLWVALSLALAGSATAAQTAHRASLAPLGGVNIVDLGHDSKPAEADRAIGVARQLHAQVVRTELPWAVLEPRGPEVDAAAQAFTDRLMNDAAAAHIRVIAIADKTPCWASSAPTSLRSRCSPMHSTGANTWPPSDPNTYASFVAYLAQRYGTRLAAIEIWNEPDQANEAYFAGPHKASRYAAILRAAYPAIKQANPQVPVLGGSIVGSSGVFLRALYAAGIKGYYDGLSVHFYTLTLASVRAIHEVQLANLDATPLWLNEFGWSSCWPGHKLQQEQACVTRQTQAQNLTNVFRTLARAPYVAADVVYKLQSSRLEDFGAVTSSGGHKPAFSALSHVLASPFGKPSRVTLSLRRTGARVVASGSGPVGDFMRLEAFQGRLLRFQASFVLDRFNKYSLSLPSVLGNRLRVRVYQYWGGLSSAVSKSS